jgi:hypothetical protein
MKFGRKRCQAINNDKERCSRDAVFKLDLRKKRKMVGYELPTFDCCFYCSQHARMIAGSWVIYGLIKATPLIIKEQMTEEQQSIFNEINQAN